MKYGRLTVLSEYKTSTGHTKCRCICDCGNTKDVYKHHLLSGATSSCGCYNRESHTKHGASNSRIYSIADSIISRCKPTYHDSHRYYYRGIKNKLGETRGEVYEKLLTIDGYFDGAQIDRIDNNGDYEIGNLRWVTPRENILNSSILKSKEWYATHHSFRQTFKVVCKNRGWDINNFKQIYSGIKGKSGDKRFYYEKKSM